MNQHFSYTNSARRDSPAYIRAVDSHLILSNIRRQVNLEPEEEAFLLAILVPAAFKQGELVQPAGEVTRSMIHVNTGCLMTYYSDRDGDEKVIQFATVGWWTGDLHSLTTHEPSVFETRALADSTIFFLPGVRMDELMSRYPVFERYFRITFQNSLVTHQKRIIQAYSFTAEERYDDFQKKYPQLEQFVPLKYVASYLGITPEFLSKIRRKRAHK
ncbi:MAG: Crp/Fnr family transcriptional regulator [Cyclobacteriaceae bacterium]|nr:Crp/Fnr family transcriptional regulator [Cyclobacteriaceae bacterium]